MGAHSRGCRHDMDFRVISRRTSLLALLSLRQPLAESLASAVGDKGAVRMRTAELWYSAGIKGDVRRGDNRKDARGDSLYPRPQAMPCLRNLA